MGALLLFLGTAGRAHGDTFDLTWTGAYGPGSAILTASNDGPGEFTVSAITGNQNGSSIVGLANYGDNDNAIFFPATVQLDFFGLAFKVGSTDYNLFAYTLPGNTNVYTECSSAVALSCTGGDVNNGLPVTSLSITPATSAVPEPTSIGLLCPALLGALGLLRRKTARS